MSGKSNLQGNMPNRIRNETDDAIFLDSNKFDLVLSIGTLIIIWGVLNFIFSYPTYSDSESWVGFIFMTGLGVLCLTQLLYNLQVITVNKKSQRITIQYLYNILKEEIPFSNIERIELNRIDSEASNPLNIKIITNQGRSIKIYKTCDELNAERVVGRIRIITSK